MSACTTPIMLTAQWNCIRCALLSPRLYGRRSRTDSHPLTAVCCVPQVSFSEGGPGSNSTGSEVASMSSQLPDTPNSMVSSPIEAWTDIALADELNTPPCSPSASRPTAPNNNPPGRIFTLWRQSWDFYQTPIFMSVHRIQLVASLWPEPPRLATIQDPDSIKNKNLRVEDNSETHTSEMLCARPLWKKPRLVIYLSF